MTNNMFFTSTVVTASITCGSGYSISNIANAPTNPLYMNLGTGGSFRMNRYETQTWQSVCPIETCKTTSANDGSISAVAGLSADAVKSGSHWYIYPSDDNAHMSY
jgi:hypothetical protein